MRMSRKSFYKEALMSPGKLARALALATLLCGGCLVEPSPNVPPANSGGAGNENRAGVEPGPTPSSRPTPEGGPSLKAPDGLTAVVEAGGKLGVYVRAAAADLAPEQREALGRVDTHARSVDEQLKKWNENDSVARAGEELLARAREELAGASYAEAPAAADVQRFERFLRGAATRATPTLAVPGLSPHGQSRAFDFQVMRGTQLIAGPTGAGAWDSAGWTEKVRAAVTRASTKFTGPLASPREPWHYDYKP